VVRSFAEQSWEPEEWQCALVARTLAVRSWSAEDIRAEEIRAVGKADTQVSAGRARRWR
jgi:hypothetical protein